MVAKTHRTRGAADTGRPRRVIGVDSSVAIAAREFTPRELCFSANAAHASGQFHLEARYLDALALQAKKHGWVSIVEQCLIREEEDDGEG